MSEDNKLSIAACQAPPDSIGRFAQIWQTVNVCQTKTSTGEIVVRSPWLTQSYYKNQDAGNELWEGGYLHPRHRLDGRKRQCQNHRPAKRCHQIGGEWISSLEVETIMSLHPSVADIAVIAIPDARWGERPMALIVLKPDYQDTKAEDIIAIAQQAYERGHLPKYGIPCRMWNLSRNCQNQRG